MTGSDRLPSGGFARLNPEFAIVVVQGRHDGLPSARTCFNRLELPDYSEVNQLRERLMTALHQCESFEME